MSVALRSLPWLLLLVLGGCADAGPPTAAAGAPAAAARIEVYRHTGALQCNGGGQSLAQLQAGLEAAGVSVRDAACGSDGRMYAAVCGGADGSIGIFGIGADQLDAARAAGYAALDELPDAQRLDCPASAADSAQ